MCCAIDSGNLFPFNDKSLKVLIRANQKVDVDFCMSIGFWTGNHPKGAVMCTGTLALHVGILDTKGRCRIGV